MFGLVLLFVYTNKIHLKKPHMIFINKCLPVSNISSDPFMIDWVTVT